MHLACSNILNFLLNFWWLGPVLLVIAALLIGILTGSWWLGAALAMLAVVLAGVMLQKILHFL